MLAQQPVLPDVLSTAAGTGLEVRLDYARPNDVGDASLFAVQLQAQHITAQGFGAYATLPLVFATSSRTRESAIGNFEIGGLYVVRNSDGSELYLRGGLAVNTANDSGVLGVPNVNVIPRLIDAPSTGLDSHWGRGCVGVRGRRGAFVYGGAAHVDVPFDSGSVDPAPFFGVTASVGVAQPRVGVSGGFSLIHEADSNDSDDDTLVGFNIVADTPLGPKVRIYGVLGGSFEAAIDGYSIGLGFRFGI